MTADAEERNGRSRAFLALMAVLGALFFVLFAGLGVWQVERLQWKLALIAHVDARVHAAPAAAPGRDGWAKVNRDGDEYRHVTATGTYLADKQVLVRALTERGAGYWVMTPLRGQDGALTFVNRGFTPPEKRETALAVPQGPVSVTGLLRMPEPDGFFLRPNTPEKDDWNSRDVAAFARRKGLGAVAPYFIDAEAGPDPAAYPVGGLTVVSFPNSHLSYAITWFALAAMVAGAAVFVWRQERKAD